MPNVTQLTRIDVECPSCGEEFRALEDTPAICPMCGTLVPETIQTEDPTEPPPVLLPPTEREHGLIPWEFFLIAAIFAALRIASALVS